MRATYFIAVCATPDCSAACRFGRADDGGDARTASPRPERCGRGAEAGRSFEIAAELPADAPLLGGDELAGDILLTFDRLLPAYACASRTTRCRS